jgi:hypothetical protein
MKLNLLINNKIVYICIAHINPFFELPDYYNVLKTGDFELSNFKGNVLSIKNFIDADLKYKPVNNYYADYSFSFMEELFNNNQEDIEFIFLTLHRKFITRDNYGKPSQNFFGMNIANNISKNSNMLSFDRKSDFLVSKPLIFNDGIVGQYSRKHNLQDFITFNNLLIESNILSNDELEAFEKQKILIPAVPVGLLPYRLFYKIICSLSNFVKYTDFKGYEIQSPDDQYQSRARSFFLERLASFLFLKYLNMTEINFYNNKLNFGHLITINPKNDSNIYTGGSI